MSKSLALPKAIQESTTLAGEELERALGLLRAAIEQYRRAMESYERQGPAMLASSLDTLASKIEGLCKALAKSPPLAQEVIGLSPGDLARRAETARQIASLTKEDAGQGRSRIPGFYRDGLARKAREILEAHCTDPPNLRRAVAAVLTAAGAKFDDPKKEAGEFDAMMQPWPAQPIDEKAETEKLARRGRLSSAKF